MFEIFQIYRKINHKKSVSKKSAKKHKYICGILCVCVVRIKTFDRSLVKLNEKKMSNKLWMKKERDKNSEKKFVVCVVEISKSLFNWKPFGFCCVHVSHDLAVSSDQKGMNDRTRKIKCMCMSERQCFICWCLVLSMLLWVFQFFLHEIN